MCNLSEENIHKGKNGSLWIRINRHRCDIPLLDIPQQIMEKYKTERKGDKLFNMVTLSCVAINLNKVAKLCEIEKRITYHQSRHNFAALITLFKGVPLETVSQMMGHKCFQTPRFMQNLHDKSLMRT
jgi:site-specific recombinase XerD